MFDLFQKIKYHLICYMDEQIENPAEYITQPTDRILPAFRFPVGQPWFYWGCDAAFPSPGVLPRGLFLPLAMIHRSRLTLAKMCNGK